MPWEVEVTDEFVQWWDTLTVQEREALRSKLSRLAFYGRSLTSPHSKQFKGTRNELYELRSYSRGRPLRAVYAFDPRNTAIVLMGGDKTGDRDFYKRYLPIADDLYDAHIARLERQGLI